MAFVREMGLQKGESINMTLDHGKIIIEPVRQKRYTLTELVESIQPAQQGGEVDWGEDVGEEIIP